MAPPDRLVAAHVFHGRGSDTQGGASGNLENGTGFTRLDRLADEGGECEFRET